MVESARKRLSRTLAAAKTLSCKTVYMTHRRTRRRSNLGRGRGESSVPPSPQVAEEARKAGVELLIEPAPALYTDVHLTHTLRDTVQLAEQADIGVYIGIFSSWTEPRLRETIEPAMRAATESKSATMCSVIERSRVVQSWVTVRYRWNGSSAGFGVRILALSISTPWPADRQGGTLPGSAKNLLTSG